MKKRKLLSRGIKGKSTGEPTSARPRPAISKRHPLFGFMKGTVRVAPGVDLTEPADLEWGERAYGDLPHDLSGSMTLAEFKRSQSKPKPPTGLAPALAALWWAGKDKWDKAHGIVMNEEGKDCAWVHAHLHRVEGDLDNARYWYRQVGKSAASGSLDAEWEEIVRALLA